jgi:hypothetical protein
MIDTVAPAPRVKDLLRGLVDRFPLAFSNLSDGIRPLKVGIYDDLVQATDLDPALLRRALRFYTGLTSYQRALTAEGAMRVDLAGAPVEPVAAEHAAFAQAKLANGRTGATPTSKASTNGTAPAAAVWCTNPTTLMKGISPMQLTASLKLVLRDPLPQSRVKDGYRYFALQNLPKGVPAGVTLAATPLYLGCSEKHWTKARKTAEQIQQQ